MKFDADQPASTHRNYPLTASNPIRAYRPDGRQCRCKADLDFLAFCILKETTRTTADDLNEDDAERPRFPRAVMDRRSRPGPEPTTLEAVGNQWRYALEVVQAGDDDDDDRGGGDGGGGGGDGDDDDDDDDDDGEKRVSRDQSRPILRARAPTSP